MSNWNFHTPCEFCNQPKNECKQPNGCSVKGLSIEGDLHQRIPYVEPILNAGYTYCHDCGVTELRYHHPGCDMELCPQCRGQLISCECELDDQVLEEFVKVWYGMVSESKQ